MVKHNTGQEGRRGRGDPPLDSRKRLILRAVVRDYVETAEPVGSGALAERHDLGVKPATLRNEMAEMAELGYLRQPHTSAGRVPSDKGYRFYVDWLSTPSPPSAPQQRQLRTQIEQSRAEVESILQQTCRLLSALTHCISVVTPPAMGQDVIRQVYLAALDRSRLLVVLALATGRVEHALVSVDGGLPVAALGQVEEMLGAALLGRTVGEGMGAIGQLPEPLPPPMEEVFRPVARAVEELLARHQGEESGQVLLEGTSEVLRQPEFSYTTAIRSLMELLEERRLLLSLLRDVYLREAWVVIGSESGDPRIHMCTLVAARYTVLGRCAGTIGVLGPTRMDYDRTLPAVRFMARSLGEVLSKLSL